MRAWAVRHIPRQGIPTMEFSIELWGGLNRYVVLIYDMILDNIQVLFVRNKVIFFKKMTLSANYRNFRKER